MSTTCQPPHVARRGLVVVLMVAMFFFPLVQLGMAPALTDIGDRLQRGPSETVWVMSAFLLASAVFAPLIGSLSDMLGRRLMFAVSMGLVALGSLIALVGVELWQIIVGRVMQGAVAGVFPLSFGLAREAFAPPRQARVIGLLTAVAGVGAGFAMLLGGALTDAFSYRAVLAFNLVGALVLLGALVVVPRSTPGAQRGRVDVAGAVLLSGGVFLIMLAITQIGTWAAEPLRATALIAGATILFAVLVVVENRVRHPLLDFGVLFDPALVVVNIATILTNIAGFVVFVLVPQYAQTVPGAGHDYGFASSATLVGALLLPAAMLTLLYGPLLGRIGTRIGHHRALAIAAAMIVAGLGGLAIFARVQPMFFLAAGLSLIGLNLAFTSMTNAIVATVPAHNVGAATGANSLVRTVGNALGAQLTAGILAAHVPEGAILPSLDGYLLAFSVCAAAGALAVIAALGVPRGRTAEVDIVRSGQDARPRRAG